jgi:pilus assembly protein CpaE
MTATRRVAVAVDGSASSDSILRLFDGGDTVDVAAVLPANASRVSEIDDRHLDAIIVVCRAPTSEVIAFTAACAREKPWLPIVVACRPDAEGLRDALAAGAADIVALTGEPDEDRGAHLQMQFALQKVIAQRAGVTTEANAKPGEVVTILGPKGGTGKTLTTCNLAVALARAGQRVAVVDLDLQFGDVGLALALEPSRTIYDLANAGGQLDTDRLNDYLVQHESGVRVLLAPARPDQAASVGPDLVRSVLTELRLMCDVVVVDTPPGFTPEVIAAIDSSTALCVVAGLDSLSLKNTRLALDTLGLMGYPDDALQLVLNRADSKVGVHPSDVEALLGRWPDILVPSSRNITRAVNEGRTIVQSEPNSEAAKAFAALARAYIAEPAESSPSPLRRVRRKFKRSNGVTSIPTPTTAEAA